MTAREVIFAIVIAGIAGTLLLDIVSFVSQTLQNFLRQAKTKENPINTNPDPLMTMVLDDLQSLGLIDVTPEGLIDVTPDKSITPYEKSTPEAKVPPVDECIMKKEKAAA